MLKVAEREGFEPSEQFPVHRFSKPALSATQPSLLPESTATSTWHQRLPAAFCPNPNAPAFPLAIQSVDSIAGAQFRQVLGTGKLFCEKPARESVAGSVFA